MDPGVRNHGMKADTPGYLWSKYECFLMSGWWDILHSSCLNVKLWSNSMNGTEVWMNEQSNEHTNGQTERRKLYTPQHKCRGYNQSSLLIGTKPEFFTDWKHSFSFPQPYRCYMWNLAIIGFMASEMSFENVDDDGRTTDACLYYKLTYETLTQVS